MNILPPCLCNKPQQSAWLKFQCSNCLGVLKESQHINYSSQQNLQIPPSDSLSKSLLDYMNMSAKTSHKRSCTDKSQNQFANVSQLREKTRTFTRNPSEPILIHKANQLSVPVCIYKKKEKLRRDYSYDGHRNSVNAVALSDNKIWSAGRDYKISSWIFPPIDYPFYTKSDLQNCYSSQIAHSRAITSITLPNSDFLLSSSLDSTVKLWKITDKLSLLHIFPHKSAVKTLSALPKHFISATSDSKLQIFDWESSHCISTFTEHLNPVNTIDVHRSNTFLSGSQDYSVKLWDFRTAHSISSFSGHCDEVTIVKIIDQYCFVSGSKDHTVKTWDIRTMGILDNLKTGQVVNSLDFMKDCVVTAGEKLQVWRKGKLFAEETARAKCVKYCANSKSIIVGSYDSSVSIYKIML